MGLLILGCLFLALHRDVAALGGGSLQVSPLAVAVSLGCGLAASVLSAWSWTAALRSLAVPCSFRAASRVWYNTMVARYIPGTLPGIAYRVYLTSAMGVDRTRAAAATIVDWVCWLVSALLACLVTLPWWAANGALPPGLLPGGRALVLVLALPAGLLLLHPRVLRFLIGLASKNTGAASLPETTYRQMLALLPIYLVKWPFYGLSLAVFLPIATGQPPIGQVPAATGAFALGWVAGFVSPFAPGGLGVREACIVGILHHGPTRAILEAALLSRLMTTVAEILCWAWATLSRKQDS